MVLRPRLDLKLGCCGHCLYSGVFTVEPQPSEPLSAVTSCKTEGYLGTDGLGYGMKSSSHVVIIALES